MTIYDLPASSNWSKLLREYSLLNLFCKMLVPGMAQNDLLLEIVMLVSTIASDLQVSVCNVCCVLCNVLIVWDGWWVGECLGIFRTLYLWYRWAIYLFTMYKTVFSHPLTLLPYISTLLIHRPVTWSPAALWSASCTSCGRRRATTLSCCCSWSTASTSKCSFVCGVDVCVDGGFYVFSWVYNCVKFYPLSNFLL